MMFCFAYIHRCNQLKTSSDTELILIFMSLLDLIVFSLHSKSSSFFFNGE